MRWPAGSGPIEVQVAAEIDGWPCEAAPLPVRSAHIVPWSTSAIAIGLCLLLPGVPEDLAAYPLLQAPMRAFVSPVQPLVTLGRPATEGNLSPNVQLVLSDPAVSGGPNYGVAGARLWQFVDLARRLDVLLPGFGWCRMPEHLLVSPVATGVLTTMKVHEDPTLKGLAIYAAHRRHRALAVKGRWLLDDLRRRLVC